MAYVFRFKQFVERIRFFSHIGNVASVIVHETEINLYSFFRFGESKFVEEIRIFRACGDIPSGEIVLPRNSTCLTPKWHFSNVSFNRA